MVIGRIKLAPGNPAWFDHVSGIYLTIAMPYADIKTEMNVSNVKLGLHYGTIKLVDGVVELDEDVMTVDVVPEPIPEAKVMEVEEAKAEEVAEEAPKAKAKKSKKQGGE